jgi:hypothetical protein
LTWITPFDFRFPISDFRPEGYADQRNSLDGKSKSSAPTLRDIVDALMERMTLFLPGKRRAVSEVWATLPEEMQTALRRTLERTQPLVRHRQAITAPPREWPGTGIGTQIFDAIPPDLIPYLAVASIIHIGGQTHLGCGTFRLA